ncbi:MAG: biotin--[acetyl-CoA-carboxylase] ligase [Flavobacteriaceae bacterium]
MKLIKLDAIDSTNIYVKELIAKGDIKNYTAVISKYQTNGRGRNNSIWQDEPSKNLNFTLYKEFNSFKIENKFLLNIISSISVFKLLKKYNLKNLSVKWPNDIMTGNKKISGILIENNIRGKLINYSVIGIGINVNQLNFKNLPKATSLHIETGVTNSPELMAEELQQILKLNFELMLENPDELLNDYNKFLFEKDKTANFLINGKIFLGKLTKVNKLGEILIRNNDGVIEKFNVDEIKLIY